MNEKSLRITSGTAKNRKLEVPDIPGIRPVQEKVKLAIFAILEDKVIDAEVLDLFSGSGNLGLEALSRGAAWCDFVDEQWNARQSIQKNIKNCGFEDRSEVFLQESVKYVANTDKKYDIIFADPFYESINHRFLVKNLEEIVKDDGVIMFLHGDTLDMKEMVKDTNLKIFDTRRYGKTILETLKR